MASGRYTSRQLVDLYLRRIDEIDRRGPTLRSVIEINPDARSHRGRARRRAEGEGAAGAAPRHPGPHQGQHRHRRPDDDDAGSLALEGSIAPRDAFVVERLRAAGAVILGKTNLSEWANFRSTKSASGWSARGGQVRNPYVLDRNACGSSSGTGAAIAANLAAVGVGTETDGSIVCPSSADRARRPEADGRPREPLRHHSDLADAGHGRPDDADRRGRRRRCSTAMRGADPRDPATTARREPRGSIYARASMRTRSKGARIGVARKRYFGYSAAGGSRSSKQRSPT